MKSYQENKKALVDFEIIEKFEAGIILFGWEVKSIKNHQITLGGSYVKIKEGEDAYLVNAKIKPWKFSAFVDKEQPDREKKLLLHKKQIRYLLGLQKQSGISIVPLSIYSNEKGLIKLLLGVGKGRKKYDKRNRLKEKDMARRIEQDRRKHNF